ncbi:MAG: ribose 5-phosphate isomerase B [Desulfuromonadaceae bacterium]|nr:ribose 5-phosphate isomerase B [Desulfuromonas sp.]MDY0185812.1 ribose 5-phosphate isomerase B [Desulfuromonadaceae bacterium]
MLYIASDHGGFDLKKLLKECLREREVECIDLGVDSRDSVDYPDLAAALAHEVQNDKDNQGILICGTGIGMSIAANKFSGIRAALVHDEFTARMAREHNNANVLVLGGRVLNPRLACKIVQIWLDSAYEGGRHQNRLDKINALEHAE